MRTMVKIRLGVPPRVCIAASVVVLLAGCSGGAPAPTSSLASPGVPLGTTQTLTNGADELAVTAYSLRQVQPGQAGSATPRPGNHYTGLDVEVCPNFAYKLGSNTHWALTDSKNSEYQPQRTEIDELAPHYPISPMQVAANECTRGWVIFQTKDGQPITTVEYFGGSTLQWTVAG
jgi:hypothetical protein